MSHQDELARLRAEADQSKMLMRELAATAFAFYSGCREAGFDEDQALQLTQTWLVTLIQTAPLSQLSDETAELFKKIFGEGES
jgi:hypothetical protein